MVLRFALLVLLALAAPAHAQLNTGPPAGGPPGQFLGPPTGSAGNFLGVWLSGLAIAGGLGWTSPLWVGASLSGLGLVVLLAAVRSGRPAGQFGCRGLVAPGA